MSDLSFREDWEFLVRNEALPEERMRAVETGGCPHAAIREVLARRNFSYTVFFSKSHYQMIISSPKKCNMDPITPVLVIIIKTDVCDRA